MEKVSIITTQQRQNPLLNSKGCQIMMTEIEVTNSIITEVDELLYCYDSSTLEISNSSFESFNARLLTISNSKVKLSNTKISTTRVIRGEKSQAGAAIFGTNSDVEIIGCTFEFLQANNNGGALSLSQVLNKRQSTPNKVIITSSTFNNNE